MWGGSLHGLPYIFCLLFIKIEKVLWKSTYTKIKFYIILMYLFFHIFNIYILGHYLIFFLLAISRNLCHLVWKMRKHAYLVMKRKMLNTLTEPLVLSTSNKYRKTLLSTINACCTNLVLSSSIPISEKLVTLLYICRIFPTP